jgi:hypothetical protein
MPVVEIFISIYLSISLYIYIINTTLP